MDLNTMLLILGMVGASSDDEDVKTILRDCWTELAQLRAEHAQEEE